MPSYAVKSQLQRMLSTSLVNPVFDWVQGDDGKRKQSKEQARDDDTGMPLWDVEVMYKQTAYGRESTATAAVRVGSPVQPVLREFAPVEFAGLVVEVRMLKNGTGIGEQWRAEAIADEKTGEKPAAVKAAVS